MAQGVFIGFAIDSSTQSWNSGTYLERKQKEKNHGVFHRIAFYCIFSKLEKTQKEEKEDAVGFFASGFLPGEKSALKERRKILYSNARKSRFYGHGKTRKNGERRLLRTH